MGKNKYQKGPYQSKALLALVQIVTIHVNRKNCAFQRTLTLAIYLVSASLPADS